MPELETVSELTITVDDVEEWKLKHDVQPHTMRILNRTGDTAVAWKPEDPVSVKNAETQFDQFRSQGFAMFAVEAPGKKPELVRSFDPEAFEILAVPALAGG